MAAIRTSAAPDGVQQLPVGERLAGVLDQHREESILDGGEVDLTVGHPDLAVQQVYPERTDGELALPGTPGDPRGMAQGDVHAGEELRRPEGFRQIEVLRGAADHEPRDEHGDDGEHKHPVKPRADPAGDYLPELDQPERYEAAERRVGVVHGVHRNVGGRSGGGGPERGVGDAKAHLLALDEDLLDRLAGGIEDRITAGIEFWLLIARWLKERHGLIGVEVLNHPLAYQDNRKDQRKRQENVERAGSCPPRSCRSSPSSAGQTHGSALPQWPCPVSRRRRSSALQAPASA